MVDEAVAGAPAGMAAGTRHTTDGLIADIRPARIAGTQLQMSETLICFHGDGYVTISFIVT